MQINIMADVAALFHISLRARGIMTPVHEILMRLMFCVAALIATIVVSRFEGEPWFAYGLKGGNRTIYFTFGFVAGITALSALIALIVLTGNINVTRSTAFDAALVGPAILWLLVFLLVAWSEELIFRGYVFFRLARDLGPVPAALRTSLIFASVHAFNHGESVIGLIQAFLYGLVACFAIWRTGSLWWAAGMHTAWDWSQSFLFGASDSGQMVSGHWLTTLPVGASWLSGGATGPEASLFSIPVLGLLSLLVLLAFSKTAGAESFEVKRIA